MTDQILIKDLPAHIRMRAEENRAIYRSRQNGSYCSPGLIRHFVGRVLQRAVTFGRCVMPLSLRRPPSF